MRRQLPPHRRQREPKMTLRRWRWSELKRFAIPLDSATACDRAAENLWPSKTIAVKGSPGLIRYAIGASVLRNGLPKPMAQSQTDLIDAAIRSRRNAGARGAHNVLADPHSAVRDTENSILGRCRHVSPLGWLQFLIEIAQLTVWKRLGLVGIWHPVPPQLNPLAAI